MRASISPIFDGPPQYYHTYRDEGADYDNEPPNPLGIVTREKQADYRSKTYHNPDRGCQT